MSDQIVIKGFCADAFLPMKQAFEQNFAEGLEIGASLAVSHQDEIVVDLCCGFSDMDSIKPREKMPSPAFFPLPRSSPLLVH